MCQQYFTPMICFPSQDAPEITSIQRIASNKQEQFKHESMSIVNTTCDVIHHHKVAKTDIRCNGLLVLFSHNPLALAYTYKRHNLDFYCFTIVFPLQPTNSCLIGKTLYAQWNFDLPEEAWTFPNLTISFLFKYIYTLINFFILIVFILYIILKSDQWRNYRNLWKNWSWRQFCETHRKVYFQRLLICLLLLFSVHLPQVRSKQGNQLPECCGEENITKRRRFGAKTRGCKNRGK